MNEWKYNVNMQKKKQKCYKPVMYENKLFSIKILKCYVAHVRIIKSEFFFNKDMFMNNPSMNENRTFCGKIT